MNSNIKTAAVWLCATIALCAIALPIFAPEPRTRCGPQTPLPNVKQLATAAIIYSGDYDDRLPNAVSMSTARAQLYPYCKNTDLFKPFRNMAEAPTYNFNIAGVNQTSLSEAQYTNGTIIYALARPTYKPNRAYQSFPDGHVKLVTLPKLTDSLAIQFDRTGAALAPAGYLPEPDPVK